MKTLRLFCTASALTLMLTLSAFAGEMTTGRTGEISTTRAGEMTTMVTAADIAIETAVSLVQSVLAL